MRPRPSFLLALLGILPLMGCLWSDSDSVTYVAVPGYLVNGIAVADIDSNSKLDILGLVSTDYNGGQTQGYISTRTQNSDGSWVLPPTRFGVGRGPASMVVADLNGDGRPDLVVANAADKTISVRLADPARPGFFLPATLLATPGRTPLDVAVGDLDGDGKVDIVVAASGANNVMAFLQGSTPGSFLAPVTFGVGGDPQAVAVADLDGDGHLDIAVGTAANTVSVLTQLQFSPTLIAQSSVDYPTGTQPVAVRAADLKGDGRLALLTANYGSSSNPGNQGLSILMPGTTPGTFVAPVHYVTGYRSTSLAVGDLNNDGKMDVVVTNSGLPGDPGSVSVFQQDPATAGALLAPTSYLGTYGPMGVAIADLDGDGAPDLVLADGDIVVRYGNPTQLGTFGPPQFFYN